jgi:hypothetical protein
VQQRVGGSEPALADESREQGERRGLLGAAGGRCQRRARDDHGHRPVGGDDRGEDEHEPKAQRVSGQQHRAAGVSVGDRPAHGAEQHVRQQPADRGGADPRGRSGRLVHVGQQRRVLQPISDLRDRTRADDRAGVSNGQHVAIRRSYGLIICAWWDGLSTVSGPAGSALSIARDTRTRRTPGEA